MRNGEKVEWGTLAWIDIEHIESLQTFFGIRVNIFCFEIAGLLGVFALILIKKSLFPI